MTKNFVEELRWRGMLQDIMPGTEEQLMKEVTTAYAGIDPTADRLHIGHLCGATGMQRRYTFFRVYLRVHAFFLLF